MCVCCRYTRSADWGYVKDCANIDPDLPLIGNGDVFSWTDYAARINQDSDVATAMIARLAESLLAILYEALHLSCSVLLGLLHQLCRSCCITL